MRWLWLLLLIGGCTVERRGKPRGPVQPPVADVPAFEDAECHADSAGALMRCVESARIADDTRALAIPRGPGSPGHASVRATCRERFASLGYRVEEHSYPGGINVVGRKGGVTLSEAVIVSAHYDAVPGCAGADDNASGVAALLEVARVLVNGRYSRTLVVACWDGGERDQEGSTAYVLAAELPVAGMISLESVGYVNRSPGSQRSPEGFERLFPDQALALLDNEDRGDFLTLVADTGAEAWAQRAKAMPLAVPVHLMVVTEAVRVKQKRLHRSDHASFWDAGHSALLITDTGPFRNPRAHCNGGSDDPEALDFAFAAEAARLAVFAAADRLELRSPSEGFAQ